MSRLTILLAVAFSCTCGVSIADDDTPPGLPKIADRETLERRFDEMLSGATLIGSFTDSNAPDAPASVDRYTISDISKLREDYWIFETRIEYGDQDRTMRLPLQVKWAGDTPVVTLTNVLVPGLGQFTARVLFYGDRYAGTWQGSDHGGVMFGRIVRDGEERDGEEEESSDEE